MSDWELEARKSGLEKWAWKIHTDKLEDLRKLRKLGLPTYQTIESTYQGFSEGNHQVVEFINRNISEGYGFCIRAIPTREGKKRGLSRRPKVGFMDFKNMKKFLRETIRDSPKELWNVSLDNWEPSEYGGIIISSGGRYISGEIGRSLSELERGEGAPLASFIIDRGKVGHITNKTNWLLGNNNEKKYLWEALKYVMKGDNFDPYFEKGYFEFVITKSLGKVIFIDYKDNNEYLR